MKSSANIDSFISIYDKLKQKGRVITNSFASVAELTKTFNSKDCFICSFDHSLFVVIPEYSHYELYYYSLGLEELSYDLNALKEEFPNSSLKIKLVTRKPEIEQQMSDFFLKNDFEEKCRILRVCSTSFGILEHIDVVNEIVNSTPKEYRHVRYAKDSEVMAVQELLLTEFDPVNDSVPDINEIRENIEKQQVIVVTDEQGKVLSLRYFTVENDICSFIFEVTHKDYRKYCLPFQIILFFAEENKRNGIKYKKFLGWRNAQKSNLVKFSKSMKDFPDGTVINVFFYESK